MTPAEFLSLEFDFQNTQWAHLLLMLDTCIGLLKARIQAQLQMITKLEDDARDDAEFCLDEFIKALREFDRIRESVRNRLAAGDYASGRTLLDRVSSTSLRTASWRV